MFEPPFCCQICCFPFCLFLSTLIVATHSANFCQRVYHLDSSTNREQQNLICLTLFSRSYSIAFTDGRWNPACLGPRATVVRSWIVSPLQGQEKPHWCVPLSWSNMARIHHHPLYHRPPLSVSGHMATQALYHPVHSHSRGKDRARWLFLSFFFSPCNL